MLDDRLCSFPDAVKRTAVAVEVFHKASLVHDDIEDDDDYRYGDETVHRRYGTATAINVGDYLIGLGYRLLSSQAAKLGADVVTDILTHAAHAHVRLTEGQGAELLWRDSLDKQLTSADAIRSALGLHPFVVKKSLQQARRFKASGLARRLKLLTEADRDLKGGGLPDPLALEVLVRSLCETDRSARQRGRPTRR